MNASFYPKIFQEMENYFHPKVLSNMLTCVHNQAMGEVFMIGLETEFEILV